MATRLALALLVALAAGACRPIVSTTPGPHHCGQEAPRYPDDDSGDPGYLTDEPCPEAQTQ